MLSRINLVSLKKFEINKKLYGNSSPSGTSIEQQNSTQKMFFNFIFQSAEAYFRDYKLPPHPNLRNGQLTPASLATHWVPPLQGFVKVNFDGACSNGTIAAAAIARDDKGAFLGCITKAKDFGSPSQAEGLGCMLAIDLIHRLKLKNVIVEGDSKGIMDCINSDQVIFDWRVAPTVKACRRLGSSRNDICFVYSSRNTNRVAHSLAAHAITHSVNLFWPGGLPPPFILDSLFNDLATAVTDTVV